MEQNYILKYSNSTPLDKLAQLRTDFDNGQNLHSRTDLQKRARAKAISKSIAGKLSRLDSPLHKSYLNSVYCSSVFIQTGKTLQASKYCGNRWCLVCNNIRTGKMINEYLPKLESLSELYFITLTVPNVAAHELENKIFEMLKVFRNISDKFRKQYKRGQRNRIFSGLRKLEITYSSERANFHPHFHIVVDGRINSSDLLYEWLERFPDANIKAQDIKEANQNSLKELFKYFTKIFSKDKKSGKMSFNPLAMDRIFRAMYGKRVFQPFGNFINYLKNDIEESLIEDVEPAKEYFDLKEVSRVVWFWRDDISDWITFKRERLTQYQLSDSVKKLIQVIDDS